MDDSLLPAPVSLEQFHRDTAAIQNTAVRIRRIPDLLARFLHRPPGPGFETQPARPFCPNEFILPFLDGEELDRLNRFKVLKKQVEWSCGRFTVKSLLQDTLMQDRDLRDIRILYRDQGAPYLEDLPNHCLTLSHSDQMTAAALSRVPGPVLGIDIEALGPMPDQGFMTTAFTQREIESMAPCPEDVFRCWTLKEAYLKFIGKGFNESLHSVEVLGSKICHNKSEQPVTCRSWSLEGGYVLGLVTGEDGLPA